MESVSFKYSEDEPIDREFPYLPSEDELIEELQLYKKGSH